MPAEDRDHRWNDEKSGEQGAVRSWKRNRVDRISEKMQEEAASRRIGDLDKIRGAIEEECEEETIVYKSELVKIRASNESS